MAWAIPLLFTVAMLLAIAVGSGLEALALWYRVPPPIWARGVIAAVPVAVGLAAAVVLHRCGWMPAAAMVCITLFAVLGWWSTITPPAVADWAPEVAMQVTGQVDEGRLTLNGIRDFEWRSDEDFTERWESRTFDLSGLQTLDLFMSYWSGPTIAHMIMSFGFDDGSYLAWSVEVRRKKGGEFSPIADLFKSNSLVIIAAQERDVVGVRSNVRGEDVQLYRLDLSPATIRALLLGYVADANSLADKPRWYNSLTTNCTTAVLAIARSLGDVVPDDWRLYVNGYLPDYAYSHAVLASGLALSELKRLSHIDKRARRAGLTTDFSEEIRKGVPGVPLHFY